MDISLCIATMNRTKELKLALIEINKVLYLFRDNDIDSKLIIVDSSIDISTKKLLEEWKNKNNFNVDYNYLEPSGTDAAYKLAINKATTDYIWLLSDDDLISSEELKACLKQIINSMKENKNILINMSLYSKDLNELYIPKFIESDKNYMYIKGINNLISVTGKIASHISIGIVKKSEWLKYEKNFPSFKDLRIAGIIIQCLSKGCYLIKDPLIKLRSGNQSWTERSYKIWYITWPCLLVYLNISRKILKANCEMDIIRFTRNIIHYKSINSDISAEPALDQFKSSLHKIILFIIRKMSKKIIYKISIILSAFSRYPSITLSQLVE